MCSILFLFFVLFLYMCRVRSRARRYLYTIIVSYCCSVSLPYIPIDVIHVLSMCWQLSGFTNTAIYTHHVVIRTANIVYTRGPYYTLYYTPDTKTMVRSVSVHTHDRQHRTSPNASRSYRFISYVCYLELLVFPQFSVFSVCFSLQHFSFSYFVLLARSIQVETLVFGSLLWNDTYTPGKKKQMK